MRIKRKLLSLLLSLVMVLSLLPVTAFAEEEADPIAITEVTVFGFKAPVVGNDIHDDINLTVSEGAPYRISEHGLQWYNGSGNEILEGNSYRLTFSVYANDGFFFSSDFTAHLLDEIGNDKVVAYGFTEGGSPTNIYISSINEPAVAPAVDIPITKIQVTMPDFVTGQRCGDYDLSAVTIVTEPAGALAGVEDLRIEAWKGPHPNYWNPSDDEVFEEGTYYRIAGRLIANDGYDFGSYLWYRGEVTFNGTSGSGNTTSDDSGNAVLKIYSEYAEPIDAPAAEKIPVTSIDVQWETPVVGQRVGNVTISYVTEPANACVPVGDISWLDMGETYADTKALSNDDVFEAGHKYIAHQFIAPADGYVFPAGSSDYYSGSWLNNGETAAGTPFVGTDGTMYTSTAYIYPVCPHANTEVRNDVPAGCAAEGYTGDTYCVDCGELLETGTTIEKTPHYYVSGASHAPTCTENGYVEMTCVYCKDTYNQDNGNKAYGHAWGEWVITKEATETQTGLKKRTCAICDTTEEENIPQLVGKTPVTSLDVTVSGYALGSDPSKTTVVSNTEGVTVKSFKWRTPDASGTTYVDHSGPFEKLKIYYVEIFLDAEDGYDVSSVSNENVKINGVGTYYVDNPWHAPSEGTIRIFHPMPQLTSDYSIISGDGSEWTKGSTTGLTFTSDAPFDKFDSVKIDGTVIAAANYTAEAGSTKITLAPAYLETLSVGTHTIEIVSNDGSASTNFTVKSAEQPPVVPTNYTVTFNMNGHGDQITAQTVKEGEMATKPTDPTASGYTFDGWYADATFSAEFDFDTAIAADTTIYAKWTANSVTPPTPANYTVTFNMNGHGTQVAAQTVKEGETATKPADPSASGYTFDGWYADATFSAKFDFSSAINANTIVYAKWTEVKKAEPSKPADPTNPTQPTKPADPTSPQTGDNSHLFLWIALLFISSGALVGTAVYGKKRKYSAK